MFLSPDGSVTGSVYWAGLEEIVRERSDESVTEAGWARLEALLKEHNEAGSAPAEEPEAADAEEPDTEDTTPAKNDNKAAWVDYAVAQGVDADEAEGLTKAELVERFGADKEA